jgi:hypothetical protein
VSCCGQGPAGRVTISQKDIDNGLAFELEYGGGRSVELTGEMTGRTYRFSGLKRLGAVDPRDAPAFLRNPAFRLKRVIQPERTE